MPLYLPKWIRGVLEVNNLEVIPLPLGCGIFSPVIVYKN
jgi:hypothetical protein